MRGLLQRAFGIVHRGRHKPGCLFEGRLRFPQFPGQSVKVLHCRLGAATGLCGPVGAAVRSVKKAGRRGGALAFPGSGVCRSPVFSTLGAGVPAKPQGFVGRGGANETGRLWDTLSRRSIVQFVLTSPKVEK